MADEEPTRTGGRSHGGLYFIVGVLVAAVVVLGFLYYNGSFNGAGRDVNIKVETPSTTGPSNSTNGNKSRGE